MTSKEFGNIGEKMAADYLASLGYHIIERNWQFGKKELDLICECEDFLVFVEVKSRQDTCLEDPTRAITKRKKSHLLQALNAYVDIHNREEEVRFDVITVLLDEKGAPTLKHYESAIIPEL
ncbi:MAG: YraN family protein [Bacteroidales bacterium]